MTGVILLGDAQVYARVTHAFGLVAIHPEKGVYLGNLDKKTPVFVQSELLDPEQLIPVFSDRMEQELRPGMSVADKMALHHHQVPLAPKTQFYIDTGYSITKTVFNRVGGLLPSQSLTTPKGFSVKECHGAIDPKWRIPFALFTGLYGSINRMLNIRQPEYVPVGRPVPPRYLA